MSTLETGIVAHPTIGEDWARYFEDDTARGRTCRPDGDVWQEMTNLALTADELGYDFIFSPEHHVSPYGLTPDPVQWMTYVAGRTKRINLGTSVIVLPWHHPLRVAESIALLDNLAPDRRKHIGVGRGVAPFEYAALEVPYEDRRERFDESVEIIKLALSQETFSYSGNVFQLPQMTLRPQPVTPNLHERLLVTATSDETLIQGAQRGLGLLYAGQKSTDLVQRDLAIVNGHRVANGFEPIQPIILAWMVCRDSEQEAYERIVTGLGELMFELVNNYAQVAWDAVDRSAGYAAFVEGTKSAATIEQMAGVQALVDKQIWGTPEQCLEKIKALQEGTAATNISFQVQFGDISNEEAIGTLKLFAKDALDRMHTMPVAAPDWLHEQAHGPIPA